MITGARGLKTLALASRVLLGGIFLVAGIAKLRYGSEFLGTLSSYHLLPPDIIRMIGITLPVLEIVLGVLLVSGLLFRFALTASLFLSGVFLSANLYQMLAGNQGCGCFGELVTVSNWQAIGLDALMAGIALALFQSRSIPFELRLSHTRPVSACLLVALISAAGFPAMPPNAGALAASGEGLQEAPLNPDFEDYLQYRGAKPYSLIPSPMDMRHLEQIPVSKPRLATLQALPAAWDWREEGKVTPVKDQGMCGSCWIFGNVAAFESRVLITEGTGYDFSEQSLLVCTDPAYDYLSPDRCAGGEVYMATDTLTKKGAKLESCMPYDLNILNSQTCGETCPSLYRVTGWRLVANSADMTSEIKQAIHDYGPVTAIYYHDDESYIDDGNIFYAPGSTELPNHLISIIGWNDSIPHPQGGGAGAWIVKNSWSTDWADGGFFYLCYGSGNLQGIGSYHGTTDDIAGYTPYDPDERLYYWDEAGMVNAIGPGADSGWMASTFTPVEEGELTRVEFWTTSNNAQYEITIYDGLFGSPLGAQSGTCAELGYYSVRLDSPVALATGQDFTVAVRMTTPGYNAPIPIEEHIDGFCHPTIQTGKCFLKEPDGDSWIDAADLGLNVSLRAVVRTILPIPVDISVSLQGGGRPDSGWAVPLSVGFFSPGADVQSDMPLYTFNLITARSGDVAAAQCPPSPLGTYDVTVVSPHTLLNVRRNVAVSDSSPSVAMGTLFDGNANDDHAINISDFGILSLSYGKYSDQPGFDARADFDRNGRVNMADFGIMAINYGKSSPIELR